MNDMPPTTTRNPFEAAAAGAPPERRSAAPDTEQIRRAAEQASQFARAAESGVEKLRELAADPASFFESDEGREFKTLAETIWREAGDKLKELKIDGENLARENPGAAVLAALGVGFAMGALLRK